MYRLLAIRAWKSAAVFLNETGNSALASRYSAMAANRTAELRAMGGTPWYGSFGLHAGADAVNAGFLSPDEEAGIAAGAISDIVKLPSQVRVDAAFALVFLQIPLSSLLSSPSLPPPPRPLCSLLFAEQL
jgi:hypothetical protein